MAHPLCGANIGTLASVIRRAGLPTRLAPSALILFSVIARWPVSTAERLLIESGLPTREDLPPPVFILGHWRSGTTHLYNVMTKSDDWAFVPPVATGLPWDLFGIAKAFRPLLERALPKHRYIDNIPVTPDSPQEDEIAIANMSDLSFYHGIYFPRNFADFLNRGLFFEGCSEKEKEDWRETFVYLLRKLTKYFDGKPLLVKNPVYTGRLHMLRVMFPEAKFVHIHRNPYDVFLSMRNFYNKLFAEFALQDFGHVDIDEVILSVYERMMSQLEKDIAETPQSRLLELPYQELDRSGLQAIERIYNHLLLPGFVEARPKFERYLASVSSFEKNKFSYSSVAAAKVDKRLSHFVEKWGYSRPQTDE